MVDSSLLTRGIISMTLLALIGALIGMIVANQSNLLPLDAPTRIIPAPYRLPKIPGGTALRLAMVHDVLHERYLRHGFAWYTQRNLDARKIIAAEAPSPGSHPSMQYLDALDDLAVGLDRLGQTAEAISVLRKKLLLVGPLPEPPAAQPIYDPKKESPGYDEVDGPDLRKIIDSQNLSPLQHHQYTTLANLGTILILDALPKVIAGDTSPKIRAQIRESLNDIEQSLAINPGGHFGREAWQAILTEHLLAAFDHPDMLLKFDMIGDPLVEDPDVYEDEREHRNFHQLVYGRDSPNISNPNISPENRVDIRLNIPRLGFDGDWATLVNPDYPIPMPFDEPTLAIVGMWTLGGGPNPHFAIALARIMDNIGQLDIAWNAYERAVELQDGFWPDAAIRAKFVQICRARQDEIAKIENPTNPDAWQNTMRKQHSAELAWGLAYQKAYQDFEASQIASGIPLNDPAFYTKFFQGRPSIASPPGLSDDIIVTRVEAVTWRDFLPCLVLGMGMGMMLAALLPDKLLKAEISPMRSLLR